MHSNASTSLDPWRLCPTSKEVLPTILLSRRPAAPPAGRLLPEAQNSSQPSETLGGPSGPAALHCPAPPPFRLGWAPRRPRTRLISVRAAAGHPTRVLMATPTPKPHQFPAELAQEAVKPSAVHVDAGAPASPANSSSTPGRSGAERAGAASQRRPRPAPC